MSRRKSKDDMPMQPDGMPGESNAQDKVFPEENPPRTIGEQEEYPDPLTDPSRDDMTRPGGDVVIGDQSGGSKAATSLPTLPSGGEVDDDELEAQRAREGIVIGDGGVRGHNPFIIRGADDPGGMSAPKLDPIVNQANVELPGPTPKVDMGSKERTDGILDQIAERKRNDPSFEEGYAAALKASRGE